MLKILATMAACSGIVTTAWAESGPGWISFEGKQGPGVGKKIVLLAGDQEYRSEEALPMLAKILSDRHGFTCTVLFSTNAEGVIDPNADTSLGHPESLADANLIITSLRFRKWPAETMQKFDAAMKRGVPIIGLRTSTHAFQLPGDHPFKSYNDFGKKLLGEQWVNHWGNHGKEGTKAIIENSAKADPLLNGVGTIFCTTDVYEAYPPADATILLRGQVVKGMTADAPPAAYMKKRASDGVEQDINTPMMPVAWHRELTAANDKQQRVVCTTMGAATDLADENLRRFVVNSVFWTLRMEVPAKADVAIVGDYKPTNFGFNGGQKNLKAEDFVK